MHEAFIPSSPLIPTTTKNNLGINHDKTSVFSQHVKTRMSSARRTRAAHAATRHFRIMNEKIHSSQYINRNLPPTSPAEWLRTNETSLSSKSSTSVATTSPIKSVPSITTTATSTTSSSISNISTSTRTKALIATGLYVNNASKWLYASPPSYCNVSMDATEMQRMLEKRVFYLGPVMSNKVIRAVQLARAACTLNPILNSIWNENITVALIVADLQMDCDTVCSAVLHNLVNRPGCEQSIIENDVGIDIPKILQYHSQVVDSVNLCVDNTFTELSFSNLRELILVGAEQEHRAISLELARAVLAIRTVDKLQDEESKIQVARRTMYLYAPLANQLGIWFVQGELEELAFMYLHPESFQMIRHLVGERRRECESTLAESKEFLERMLSTTPEIRSNVRTVLIKGRVKGLYSVYRKMRRSGKKVFEIYDLLALRVIVQPKKADEESEESACYAIADVIKRYYETFESRAKDYISTPKRNGYRSLHMTVLPRNGTTPLEIQIRTEKMHHVAEFGAAAHWIYKEKSAQEEAGKNNPPSSPPSPPSPPTNGGGEVNIFEQVAKEENENRNEQIGNETFSKHIPSSSSSSSSGGLHPDSTFSKFPRPQIESRKTPPIPSVGLSGQMRSDELRQGYVTCLASAIRTSRVIVAAAGQLYGLAVGSTLQDLAHGLGVAPLEIIAVVNGSVAPLTQRLEMNDIVRFL